MKINRIHELNRVCKLISDRKFSSAIEYDFNRMVGLETSINDVECGNFGNFVVECSEFGNLAVECENLGNFVVECSEFGNLAVECENLGNFVVEHNELKNNDVIKNEVSLEEIFSRQSFLIANDIGKMILN